jgi:predicted RNase H-like HicB family nuclease
MNRILKSADKSPLENEQLHVSGKGVKFQVNRLLGKDGGYWVAIAPSIGVSGYGKTQEAAIESFDHNIVVFVDDVMEMSHSGREKYLTELGWKKNRIWSKQFSKVYVDNDGVLNNLESVSIDALEYA